MQARLVALVLCAATLAACMGGSDEPDRSSAPRLSVPSPDTWPPYPRFPARSCWARPGDAPYPTRWAPSYAPPARRRATPPEVVVERVLAGLGRGSSIRRIELGPPPPITRQHTGYFGKSRPPRDALWAYIAVDPLPEDLGADSSPARRVRAMRTQWELEVVEGALRDAFCAAGGPSLAGTSAGPAGVSFLPDDYNAQGQRFPNPTPAAYVAHVRAVAKAFEVQPVEIRLPRPLQLAPYVVVEAGDRERFADDVSALMRYLDPIRRGKRNAAAAFEAFFLEARDGDGEPFLALAATRRGTVSGSQWAWDRCKLPYVHGSGLPDDPCD